MLASYYLYSLKRITLVEKFVQDKFQRKDVADDIHLVLFTRTLTKSELSERYTIHPDRRVRIYEHHFTIESSLGSRLDEPTLSEYENLSQADLLILFHYSDIKEYMQDFTRKAISVRGNEWEPL